MNRRTIFSAALYIAVASAFHVPLLVVAQDVTPTASQPPYGEFGLLETKILQFRRPNEGTIYLRGQFHNPYGERVDGVRMIVRLRTAGAEPREIQRIQSDVKTVIEPNGTVPFVRELSSIVTQKFNDLLVVAFAKRRGEADLPAPDAKVEIEASKSQEGSYFNGNLPTINAPIPELSAH